MVARKSPFGSDFVRVDLHHSGDWQDITPDVEQGGLVVSHGARSEGGQAAVSTLGFTVRNGDGKYSPRNPASPLYGLIGRNTPARASVAAGGRYLDLTRPGARASTPDATFSAPATAMIIEWEGYRDSWTYDGADLIGKFEPDGDQRSWLVRAEASGHVTLFWYEDGVTLRSVTSPSPVPYWAGHVALQIRVNLDVGGNSETRFYWAPTIAGPWTFLSGWGQPGPSSFYDSTAPLTLGKIVGSAAREVPQCVYGWAIRDYGTEAIIASSDFTAAPASTTTHTDNQGRAWTLADGAAVTNRRVIAAGEVSEWPMEWDLKGSETVLSAVVASGITRRLGQGAAELHSVMRRALSALGPETIGYWPMEEPEGATTFAPAIGSRVAQIDGAVHLAAYQDFAGSEPMPKLGTGRIRLFTDVYEPSPDAQVRWVGRIASGDVPDEQHWMRIYLTGTLARVDVRAKTTGYAIYAFDSDGNSRGFAAYSIDMSTDQRFSVEFEQDGDHVQLTFSQLAAGDTQSWVGGVEVQDVGPLGRVTQVIFNPARLDYAESAIGHVTVENEVTSLFDVSSQALDGYDGEHALRRMGRLTLAHDIRLMARGVSSMTPQTGRERVATLLDVIRETASADGGMLHDDSAGLGLRYRTHASLYSQPGVLVPYEDNLIIPFEPLDDDALTRNRVTVKREGGSDFTVEQTVGPMSIQAPPDGVGIYDEALTRNLHSDVQTIDHARWRLHVGTWDEGRYPTLGVDLAHPTLLADPVLTRDLLALTPGDRLVITDPPPWLPPSSVDVIVTGVRITVTPMNILLQWSCVPAGPYQAAYWLSGHRWSGDGTVLADEALAADTELSVTTPAGVWWTSADGPYDIVIGGERMTVTAAEAGPFTESSNQALTVIRSVNGVVRTHAASAGVALAEPSFYGRTI